MEGAADELWWPILTLLLFLQLCRPKEKLEINSVHERAWHRGLLAGGGGKTFGC